MKYLYFFLLIALPSGLLAQSNYNPGYVIKLNGDTVKGYIDYREWEITPRSINFKANPADKKVMNFTPPTVRGFSIIGLETYVSYSGKISMDKTRFPDLPLSLDTSSQQDTIFLKQLATGKYLTLYYNGDAIKKRYFIAERNAAPAELIYHQFYNDAQVVNSSPYRGQLLIYINKYIPGNVRLIAEDNNLDYEQAYLLQFINQFNDEKVSKSKFSRFYAGISLNATTSKANDVQAISSLKTSTTFSPKIDIGIDLFNNPNVQQLIFRADIAASYINPKFYYPVTINSSATNQVYEFDQYTASITPQVLVNLYNKDKLKFYLDVGAEFNFSFYSNHKFTVQNQNAQVTNALTINNPYSLETNWTRLPLQAGFVIDKKIELFVCYTAGNYFTRYIDYYVNSSSVNVGLKVFMK